MGKSHGSHFSHVGADCGVRIISASGSFGSGGVEHSVLERMRLTWCRAAWREAGLEGQRVSVCLCTHVCCLKRKGKRRSPSLAWHSQ